MLVLHLNPATLHDFRVFQVQKDFFTDDDALRFLLDQVQEQEILVTTLNAQLKTVKADLAKYTPLVIEIPKERKLSFADAKNSSKNRRRKALDHFLTTGLDIVAGPNSYVHALADFLTRNPEVGFLLFLKKNSFLTPFLFCWRASSFDPYSISFLLACLSWCPSLLSLLADF